MSFCPNCGAKLNDGAKFCTECGTKLLVQAPVETTAPVYTSPVQPEEPVLEAPPAPVQPVSAAGFAPDFAPTIMFDPVVPEQKSTYTPPVQSYEPPAQPPVPPPVRYEPAPVPAAPKKKKTNKGLIIGVSVASGVLVLLIAVAVVLFLLLGGGITDATSKFYEEWGVPAAENHFLLYTFAVALLLCAALAVMRGQRLTAADMGFGLMIGVPNYFSARFLLLSLSSVPAVAAYPTYSVGTIVLVTLLGALLFSERLSRRQGAAMAIILVSLALLNI